MEGSTRIARQTDALLGETLDVLYQGVVVTDPALPDNPIVYANDAFLELTGYDRDEVVGHNCRFLQGAGTDPRTVGLLRDALGRGEPFFGEILNYRKDGTPFWNALSVKPLLRDDGTVRHFVASQTDVSELKALQLRAEQQGRLELLGAFAGGIAHDFNNVLLATGGFAELLADALDDGELREYAEGIRSSTEVGRRLAEQLLAFGKGSGRSEPEELELDRVVAEIVALAERVVGRVTTLRFLGAGEELRVLARRSQLEQIVFNLVVNARDAIESSGSIDVSLEAAGGTAILRVTDDGAGMTEETRARLFEAFFTTKGSAGTGLGLATVSAIVEDLGGTIDVRTQLGVGTTFSVSLPRVR